MDLTKPTQQTASDDQLLISTFELADALFGIDTAAVQEVVRVGTITPVHHATPSVLGIMNLRGRIVTVIDLAVKLGLGTVEIGPASRIFIVECQSESVGLLVDKVADVMTVERSDIKAAPENVGNIEGKHLSGICASPVGDKLVALLNLDAALAVDVVEGVESAVSIA